MMTPLEGILVKAAVSIVTRQAGKGIKKLSEKKATLYEFELHKIITETVTEYEKLYPLPEGDRISFYQSQVLVDELFRYRLHKEMDKEAVAQAIDEDPRVIVPTQEQLTVFFDLFFTRVNANPKLKTLNINDNYREAIFDINNSLKTFRSEVTRTMEEMRLDIAGNTKGHILFPEWNSQLEEIRGDIQSFRPFTGLRRLEKLQERIVQEDHASDRLIARISFLKIQCLLQLNKTDVQARMLDLAFTCYRLEKTNLDYKALAASAYFSQHEPEKSATLCEEILAIDEFHITGWLFKCFLAAERFEEVLASVPRVVKNKPIFKLRFFQWIRQGIYFQEFSELDQIGIGLALPLDLTEPITARNRYEKIMTATYFLNKGFGLNPIFSLGLSNSRLREDDNIQAANAMFGKILEAFQGSEIENEYPIIAFLSHTTDFILHEDPAEIPAMELAFRSIPDKTPDIFLKMVQGYNTQGTAASIQKGITLVEEKIPNDERLVYLNAHNHARLNNLEGAAKSVFHYLSLHPSINRGVLVNFIAIFRKIDFRQYAPFQQMLSDYLRTAVFDEPIYKKILTLSLYLAGLRPDLTPEGALPLVTELKEAIDPRDVPLSINVAYGFAVLDQPDQAYDYLTPVVDRERPSEMLLLYCKAMYKMSGHKAELLELLRKWRVQFGLDEEVVKMELELYRAQKKWPKVFEVAKEAVAVFPGDEQLLEILFQGLENIPQLDSIEEFIPLLQDRTFDSEFVAVNIARALIQAQQFQLGLDILYKQASKPQNRHARQAYITLSIGYPPGLFEQYPTVTMGTFVRLKTKAHSQVVEMVEEAMKRFPQNQLLGKALGDEITASSQFLNQAEKISIVRITNKYLALFDEIVFEAESPISDYGFSTFHFEEHQPEKMLETLIRQFGPTGKLEADRLENQRRLYQVGKISFSEVTISVFREHFIDAYFTLTSDGEKGFRAISPANSRAELNEQSVFCLDYTSFCLFFELSHRLELPYPKKFVISHFLRNLISEELINTKDKSQPEFTLGFNGSEITKHQYGETFHSSRIQTFQAMLKWIEDHCIVDDTPDTLDFIVGFPLEQRNNQLVQLLLANRYLAVRENHFLLTNDTFYYRFLQCASDKVISPLSYLQQVHLEQIPAATEFMLLRNYIGVRLSAEILQTELLKMLSGQPNRFAICLENLRFAWNSDPTHLEVVVEFLKSLYVNTIISAGSRQTIVSTTFTNLLTGMDVKDRKRLLFLLNNAFRMMGPASDEMLTLFESAARF